MLKTKAIVLNRKKINNNDALVFLYTLDHGKISLLARGLQKSTSKLAGHLEPLNLVELMIIKGKARSYVGSAISENSFLNIKSDYDKLVLAGQGIRFLIDLSFDNQTDFDIFLTLKEFLFNLNEEKDKKLLLLCFKLKMLKLLGYDFDFSFCSLCAKEGATFLDYFDKEVLCEDCFKKESFRKDRSIKMEKGALKLKNILLSSDFYSLKYLEFKEEEKKSLDDFVDIMEKIA
jgi:DNA repair protein RecO (recombination protein O)